MQRFPAIQKWHLPSCSLDFCANDLLWGQIMTILAGTSTFYYVESTFQRTGIINQQWLTIFTFPTVALWQFVCLRLKVKCKFIIKWKSLTSFPQRTGSQRYFSYLLCSKMWKLMKFVCFGFRMLSYNIAGYASIFTVIYGFSENHLVVSCYCSHWLYTIEAYPCLC